MSEKCLKCSNQRYEECAHFGGNVVSMEECGINFDNCTQFKDRGEEND